MAFYKKYSKKRKAKVQKRLMKKLPFVPSSMMDYVRMLSDPCGATPVHAPYLGTDSGYLCRTKDVVQGLVSGTFVVGAKPSVDFALAFTPSCGYGIGSSASPNNNILVLEGSGLQVCTATPNNKIINERIWFVAVSPTRSSWSEYRCNYRKFHARHRSGSVQGSRLLHQVAT